MAPFAFRYPIAFAIAAAISVPLAGCDALDSFQAKLDEMMGRPVRLSNATAAARYLDMVCSYNAVIDKINAEEDLISKKAEDVSTKEGALSLAVQIDSLMDMKIQNFELAVKQATDPSYIWPDSVASLVRDKAAADLESASLFKEFQSLGGVKSAVENNDKVNWDDLMKYDKISSVKSSAIRSILRLPARTEGCQDGKRLLSIEEIQKLQAS